MPDKNKALCMAPWVHVHAPTNGKVSPCCVATPNVMDFGSSFDTPLAEIWNGDSYKALRLQMLAGEKAAICSKCYDREGEDGKGWSIRKDFNRRYADLSSRVDETEADGFTPFRPVSFDIRFDNHCNLKCRMCSVHSSTKWIDDALALKEQFNISSYLDEDGNAVLTRSFKDFEHFFSQIEAFVPTVQEFYFAGGEPLLLKEHYRLVTTLVERKHTHIRLRYNTNLSTLSYHGHDVLALWDQFDYVHVAASLDHIGARGEFIRKGLRWDRFSKNLQRLVASKVDTWVNITVQIMNVLDLEEIVTTLTGMGVRLENIFFNILQGPDCYNIQNLTDELKAEVREQLKTGSYPPLLRDRLTDVIAYMDARPLRPRSIKKLWKITAALDHLRNETALDLFPRVLGALRDQYPPA